MYPSGSYDAYPTSDDLYEWIIGRGLFTVGEDIADLVGVTAARVAGVVAAFESATFWSPFLAGTEETRKFDGPQGFRLFVPVGIVTLSSLSISGTSLVDGSDFDLLDQKMGRYCYQSIEFANWVYGGRRIIEITGRFGFSATVPPDVFEAICAKVVSGMPLAKLKGAVKKEKAGPVEYEYASSDAAAASPFGKLTAEYDDVVARYRKKV